MRLVSMDETRMSRDGDGYNVYVGHGDEERMLGSVEKLGTGGWMAFDWKGKTLGRVFDGRAIHHTRRAAVKTLVVTHNVKARG